MIFRTKTDVIMLSASDPEQTNSDIQLVQEVLLSYLFAFMFHVNRCKMFMVRFQMEQVGVA